MSYVTLSGVSKFYGDVPAVKILDLEIQQGEFFSLLGPSGCGKSTTLRMLAGFVKPTSGDIIINNRDMTHLPPEHRNIGIVFQNYAIFPHLNVFENIAFGLRMRKTANDAIKQKVEAVLEQVGLSGYENRFQRELSGGQQQRVALARVLVIRPEILLLDEPLSALDKKMREEMKYWIKGIQQQTGITTVYVTHDQGEALTMSDRIAVMNEGAILQIGSPSEIYEVPKSRFVGEFIGESNTVTLPLGTEKDGYLGVRIGGVDLMARRAPETPENLGTGTILIRPENMILSDTAGQDATPVKGRIRSETYQGALIRYEIEVDEAVLVAEVHNTPELVTRQSGDDIWFGWHPDSGVILPD